MAILHKHNPLLRDRLTNYVEKDDAEGLKVFMQSLTVSAFRTSGYLLAEEVLVKTDNDKFWHLFITLVPTNAKAYLGTFLKAAISLYKNRKLQLNPDVLSAFSQTCSPIDRKKLLVAFLPHLFTPVEVDVLLKSMNCGLEAYKAMTYLCLLKSKTLPCYYVLFLWLKADNIAQTQQCIQHLIRINTPLAYKMASVLKSYFGIEHVPATFSLNVEDYQLSRLDQGYEKFKKLLTQ